MASFVEFPDDILEKIWLRLAREGQAQDMFNLALTCKHMYTKLWPKTDSLKHITSMTSWEARLEILGEANFGFSLNSDGSVIALLSTTPGERTCGTLHRYDVPSRDLQSLHIEEQCQLGRNWVAVSPCGRTLAWCSEYGTKFVAWTVHESVLVWDVPQRCCDLLIHKPANLIIGTFSLQQNGLRLYDLRTGRLRRSLTHRPLSGEEPVVSQYSDSCQIAIVPGLDEVLEIRRSDDANSTYFCVWDISSYAKKKSWQAPGARKSAPCFDPTGKYFCVTVDDPSSIELWSMADYSRIGVWTDPLIRTGVNLISPSGGAWTLLYGAVLRPESNHPLGVKRLVVPEVAYTAGSNTKNWLSDGAESRMPSPKGYVLPEDNPDNVVIGSRSIISPCGNIAVFAILRVSREGGTFIRLYFQGLGGQFEA